MIPKNNYINNLFSKNNSTGAIEGENNLGFSQEQANMIVPQQLYTVYHNTSSYLLETPSTDGGTYYTMFPLAARYSSVTQNFVIEDYLSSGNEMVACLIGSNQTYYQHLRSGLPNSSQQLTYAIGINAIAAGTVHNYFGVRPAFVLRIME